jgi:hypothetical protein
MGSNLASDLSMGPVSNEKSACERFAILRGLERLLFGLEMELAAEAESRVRDQISCRKLATAILAFGEEPS